MPSPSARPSYRPDIDGLRAVAVLLVLGFHAFPQWLRGGFVGVDVFFVISGFLITGILLGHLQAGDFTFRAFYAARIRRILPALIIVLIVCLGIGCIVLLPDELVRLARHTAGGASFISNIVLWHEADYFDVASQRKPLLHLWSLGVEEQFYLAWPLLLWVALRFRHGLVMLLPLLGIFSLILSLSLGTNHIAAAFYSPVTRLWELMLGAALACWPQFFPARIERQSNWRPLAALLGLGLLIMAQFLFHRDYPYPNWRALFPTLGATLLIAAGPGTPVNRLLAHRSLVGIGLISYPLYLWHWPLLSFATILCGLPPAPLAAAALLAVSGLLAIFTYHGIERPIRFGPHRQSTLWVLGSILLVIGGASGFIIHQAGFPDRRVVHINQGQRYDPDANSIAAGAYQTRPCTQGPDIMPADVQKQCVEFGDDQASDTIILWGDSHASAWSPAFFAIARELGHRRVFVFSSAGCAPLLGVRQSWNAEGCNTIDQGGRVLQTIKTLKPSIVVLIAFWSSYLNGPPQLGRIKRDPEERKITTDPTGHASLVTTQAAIATQLPATVAALTQQAHVIILKDVPLLTIPVNDAAIGRLPLFPPPLAPERSIADHLARTSFVYRAIDAVAQMPHVTVFDPTPYLCDAAFCHPQRDGVVMYSDDTHISAPGALTFVPQLRPLFNQP